MTDRMPWSKFSWDAWETDAELSLCSMAAQGFWMRLLCLAAKEDGYVLINDTAPSSLKLAHLVRAKVEEVEGWLAELDENGVFSRTARGVIYSRRLTREGKRSAINRTNGKLGGNPNLRKDTDNSGSDNHEDEPPKRTEVKADKEERREDTPVVPGGDVPPKSPSVTKADIDAVWEATPRPARARTSRKDIERSLLAAVRRGHAVSAIIAGVAAYYRSRDATKNEGEFAKGAHRIIEADRWQAFAEPASDQSSPSITDPNARWRHRCLAMSTNGYWNTNDWGPKPGRPGCEAPADILAEAGLPATPGLAEPLKSPTLPERTAA